MLRQTVLGLAMIVMLSACSGSEPRMRDLYDPNAGPEEFAVAPNKPLQMPTDLAALPAPTKGGSNLADPTPKADAVALLGGDPARVTARGAGIGAGDEALFGYATRFGMDPNIRGDLAAADEKFRKNNARWTRLKLFRVDRYNQAYRFQTLDAAKEVQRWRRAGVQTPTIPLN
jgi:hypothetical protein